MIDILMDSRSPTQQRGESKLSGGIVHDSVTNASGDQFRIRIDYTLKGDVVTDLMYEVAHTYHGIPTVFLREMVEEIIEYRNCKTLIFQ